MLKKKIAKENKSFKPIWKYLRAYKKPIQVAFILVFGENVLKLFAPLVFGKMVDEIGKGNFSKTVMVFLLIWIMLDIISGWLGRVKSKKVAIIAYKASSDLTISSINHVLRLPLAFHKEKKIGEIIQRISRADKFLYRLVDEGIFYMLPILITSIAAFFIIAFIEFKLALIYLIFIIVHIIITIFFTDPIIKYQKNINKIFEGIYGNIYDRVSSILNIKSNTTEELENQRNIQGFEKGNLANMKQYDIWLRLGFGQNLVINLGLLLFFGMGSYYISNNQITIGNFTTLLWYITMLSSYLYTLGYYYKSLNEGLVTINNSENIFNEETEDYENPDAIFLDKCEGKIEFKNVYFKYEKADVLKNISFLAEAGKTIAIVGKSGEGKSTLTNLISRYIKPYRGKILLDGVDIKKIKLTDLRCQIAIVPQEGSLFNDTIENNIRYSNMKATSNQVREVAIKANCDEFIQKFPKKYKQIVGEKGVKLSVGQKQRVAIARAILRNPKILILDEATSALDSESERLVQEALEKVMKNRTTFIIAHRLSTIRKVDKIIVLENGYVSQIGTHAELIAKEGIYKKLSDLQQLSI